MWELMPAKVKYGLPIAISILIYIGLSKGLGMPLARSISFTISSVTILAFVFGKYLWKYFYFDFFKHKFCPDFNGTWTASIKSNFSPDTQVEFPLHIEADFFSIKMTGNTTIGRTYTNLCKIVRAEDNSFELVYMFKVMNDSPSASDGMFYEGAARLRVIDINSMQMKGVFWTNRCWQNNLNTAGSITLTKRN